MFTTAQREGIRDRLIEAARDDPDIIGVAIVGSGARGAEDAWSDIDLALQLRPDADESAVVARWTTLIDACSPVADTHDVFATGGVRYRVFLLASSLQLDVSFWPAALFRATEPGFLLVFGSPADPTHPTAPDGAEMIGMGWLFALHARSALARGRVWQTMLMLDRLRDQVVALACLRHGLDPWHGRDVDRLPVDVRDALAVARADRVAPVDLDRSRLLLLDLFLAEIERLDSTRADALRAPFAELAAPVVPTDL